MIPCPLIPIITVRLPAINTLYRRLLANAPNNLQPDYNALNTRQSSIPGFQYTRSAFSDRMPDSLTNKRISISPALLTLSPYCSIPLLLSLIRVKITNWFHSSLCMNQASRVWDAPFECYALSTHVHDLLAYIQTHLCSASAHWNLHNVHRWQKKRERERKIFIYLFLDNKCDGTYIRRFVSHNSMTCRICNRSERPFPTTRPLKFASFNIQKYIAIKFWTTSGRIQYVKFYTR